MELELKLRINKPSIMKKKIFITSSLIKMCMVKAKNILQKNVFRKPKKYLANIHRLHSKGS